MCSYFIKRDGEKDYTEVSKTAYLLAEHQAGFVSRHEGEPATAMFSKNFPEARFVTGRFQQCADSWGKSSCPGLIQMISGLNNRNQHSTPSERGFRDSLRVGTFRRNRRTR